MNCFEGARDGKDKTLKYEVIIHWSEEDQAFIADVPELAGCLAGGRTQWEALCNVERLAKE